jgi:tetratricopeptide (TPR) repeat protein
MSKDEIGYSASTTIGDSAMDSRVYTAGRDLIVVQAADRAAALLALSDLRDYLRVLVIIAAPVVGERKDREPPAPLDARGEWLGLARAVRECHAPIALVRLVPPTFDALRRALAPQARGQGLAPHIVHFIGHGKPRRLAFEDELGRLSWAETDELAAAFQQAGARLVVLNACWSADADGLSVAETLVKDGATEVAIGHERPVVDSAAVAFAATLYRELAAGYTLADSFARAVDHLRREYPTQADNPRLLGDGRVTMLTGGLRGEPIVEDGRPVGDLPTVTTRFYGRGPELVEMACAMDDGRVRFAVICGVAGIGKSALAVEAAHRAGWRFPGGMAWVSAREMATFTCEAALEELARSLRLLEEPTGGPRAVLRDRCARQPTLLILDNLEIPARSAPEELSRLIEFLRGFPTDAGSKVVVTLRPPLTELEELPGAVRLPLVRGLADKPAARYVLDLAAQHPSVKGLHGERRAALKVARRLSGHPKMIEIAVGTARRRGYERLAEQLPQLSGDLAARLNELIGWSVGLVGEEGRRVLPYLALFPASSFTGEAVAIACGKRDWVQDGLDQLGDSGLVNFRPDTERYEWHQSVVEWASAPHKAQDYVPLNDIELLRARRRLIKFYLTLAHRIAKEYKQIYLELENLFLAVRWANVERKRVPDKKESDNWARRLIQMIQTISSFLSARGYWETCEEFIGWGLEASSQIGNLDAQADLWQRLAGVHYRQGDWDGANQCYMQALELNRQQRDRFKQAGVLAGLATICVQKSEWSQALKYYKQSLQINRRYKDKRGEARTLGGLASVHVQQGNYEQAKRYYEEDLRINRQSGDQHGEAQTLGGLASIYAQQGDYEQARHYYEESLRINRQIGDQRGEASSLGGLASIYAQQGDYEQAKCYYEEDLRISHQIGNRRDEARALGGLASIYVQQGDYEQARRYCEESLRINRQIGSRRDEARSLGGLASVYVQQGDYEQARHYYEESLRINRQIGNRRDEARTLGGLASVYVQQGDYEQARRHYEESLRINRQIGNQRDEAQALGGLAQLFHEEGNLEKAVELYEQALSIQTTIGDRPNLCSTLIGLAKAKSAIGHASIAIEHAMEAYGIADGQSRVEAEQLLVELGITP